MTDKFQGHTKVDINRLVLTSLTSRRSIDISSVVTQIEIYGSIFEPTICGSLGIYDGSGDIQNLPVIGEELLEIEFQSPGRKPFTKLMHVYFPDEMGFDPNGTHIQMMLHFVSVDDFQGKLANVNRGYKQNISNIVKGVLTDFTGTTRPLEVEDTKGIEHILIPGWDAWKTIEFLRGRAVSQKYNSPYLFFEDQTGYNFMSYEHLIEKREKMAEELIFTAESYLPEAGEMVVGKSTVLQRQYRNVDQLSVETKSNTMKLVQAGGASSRTMVFDVLDKTVKNIDVNYKDAKSIIKKPLGKNFNPSHTSDIFKVQRPTKIYLIPLDSTNPHATADQFGAKNMYAAILAETKIGFTTPGDSQLQPGDVFYFSAPSRVNSKEPDKQISGNYIIANLRHGINGSQMFTTIEAYKCGFEEKIL